jgi:hypothetical protein
MMFQVTKSDNDSVGFRQNDSFLSFLFVVSTIPGAHYLGRNHRIKVKTLYFIFAGLEEKGSDFDKRSREITDDQSVTTTTTTVSATSDESLKVTGKENDGDLPQAGGETFSTEYGATKNSIPDEQIVHEDSADVESKEGNAQAAVSLKHGEDVGVEGSMVGHEQSVAEGSTDVDACGEGQNAVPTLERVGNAEDNAVTQEDEDKLLAKEGEEDTEMDSDMDFDVILASDMEKEDLLTKHEDMEASAAAAEGVESSTLEEEEQVADVVGQVAETGSQAADAGGEEGEKLVTEDTAGGMETPVAGLDISHLHAIEPMAMSSALDLTAADSVTSSNDVRDQTFSSTVAEFGDSLIAVEEQETDTEISKSESITGQEEVDAEDVTEPESTTDQEPDEPPLENVTEPESTTGQEEVAEPSAEDLTEPESTTGQEGAESYSEDVTEPESAAGQEVEDEPSAEDLTEPESTTGQEGAESYAEDVTEPESAAGQEVEDEPSAEDVTEPESTTGQEERAEPSFSESAAGQEVEDEPCAEDVTEPESTTGQEEEDVTELESGTGQEEEEPQSTTDQELAAAENDVPLAEAVTAAEECDSADLEQASVEECVEESAETSTLTSSTPKGSPRKGRKKKDVTSSPEVEGTLRRSTRKR